MAEQEYDNTNRGGLWKTVATSGLVDVAGEKYYCTIARTGAQAENAPTHNIFLVHTKSREVSASVLFKSKKQNEQLAGGDITVEGMGYWISVFMNKSQHPKSPQLDIKFKEKEPEPQGSYADAGPHEDMTDDDIPF